VALLGSMRRWQLKQRAVDKTDAGDILEIDLPRGKIKNLTSGVTFTASSYPDFMAELVSAGGLIEYTKKRLTNRRAQNAV